MNLLKALFRCSESVRQMIADDEARRFRAAMRRDGWKSLDASGPWRPSLILLMRRGWSKPMLCMSDHVSHDVDVRELWWKYSGIASGQTENEQ